MLRTPPSHPLLAVALALATLAAFTASAPAATRPTLPALEPQLMCVTCKIPLNVAESSEATQERELVRELIAKGDDEAQIKKVMVAQYGPTVLSTPSTKGFGLAAYLVPIALVLALLALVARLLPRWRAAARARGGPTGPEPWASPPLTAVEAERLEQDMRRFD